jgi:hypothetical protein
VTARLRCRDIAAVTAGLCLAVSSMECVARIACGSAPNHTPPQAVVCAWALVQRASGGTDERQVSDALATLRRYRAQAGAIAEPLAVRLRHQSHINHGRDKASVLRLRATLLQTLMALGRPDLAVTTVHDTLVFLDERSDATLVAAAARTAGALGPRGRPFVPQLIALLALRVGDEAVSLEPDSMADDAATTAWDSSLGMSTAHLEALTAIERICVGRDADMAKSILATPAVAGPSADRRVQELAHRVALRLGGLP